MNRKDAYWLGYRHGKRLAQHNPHINHEISLKLDLLYAREKHRAYAVGELRGYREHRPC